MTFKRSLMHSLISTCVLGLALPATAQIEEIVVTARKTEESLQRTPVAVTALNEQMLINAQVTEIADLRRTAPNLSILPGGTGSSALVFIAIRGAAQVSPGGAADTSVGTYIDGVYFARSTGGNLDMFDVAQVEVLRGPQGTLFGRNTTGGALNIRTNDPTGEYEGYVKVDVGNYNSRRVETVLNVPFSDELAARFAYRYSDHEGYGDYKGYTDPNGFVWNGFSQDAQEVEDNMYGRFKLRWEPTDYDVVATFGAHWSEMRDTGQRSEVKSLNTDFSLGPIGTFGDLYNAVGFDPDNFIRQQSYGDAYWNADSSTINPTVYNDGRMNNPKSSNKTSGAFLNLDFDLGDYQFKSISAYGETKSTGTVDLDGTPLSVFVFNSVWDQEQYSQEFQLSGSWGDKLDWITGLYYFEESSSELSVSRFGGIFGDLFAPGVPLELVGAPVNAGSNGVFDNTSKGIFAQANYQFTDQLRGTLGLRYTKDTRDVLLRPEAPESGQIGVMPPANCVLMVDERDNPAICEKTDSVDFEYPAWVLGLDYQVSDELFVYAKTSGASMSGGWNIRATRVPAFEPEDAMDLELGFKSDLFDDTLRLNGAFFYIKYDGQQRFVNEFDPIVNSATQYVRNAGKSHAYGAEFELTWLPWDGMTITSGLALLETEYDNYEVLESIVSGPNAGQQVLVDHSSENAPQAPEMTFNVGATQLFDTSLGEVELHADYYWVDETWFADTTPRPGESAALIEQFEEEKRWQSVPDYGLFNAKATLRTNDGAWEFSLWGKNLTDKEYYNGVGNFYTGFGTAMWWTGDPRTFGASAKYSW